MNRTVAKINHFKWIFVCLAIFLIAGALFVGLSRQVKADSTIHEVDNVDDFLEAFETAGDGDTIQLTQPINLTLDAGWSTGGENKIKIDKDITLNCNEHTLTLSNKDN
ncbi:MAG: hypothetical protein GX809_01320 [Clostridiaceae bacterium]|nr:hypothetical protein [Clostridiaceae bacterium]